MCSRTCIVTQWVQCPSVGWVAGMHLWRAIHCSEWGESSASYYSPLQPVPSKSCDRPGNSHPLIWQASLCASDVVSVACRLCVCQMAVSHVWSGVGHPHVMSVAGRCSFSSFHDESHMFYRAGLMLTLEGTLQYLSFVLPVCVYAVFSFGAWACNLQMWVLVKWSTCVFKCNSCLATYVEAIALLLHSLSVGACCHAWKHLCFHSAWPVFFIYALDSD